MAGSETAPPRSSPSSSRSPGGKAPLGVVWVTVLLDLLGFGMILPLLPFYAQEFGADALGVTVLFAVYSLAQFVFAPLWGRWSDRAGRRPVLLVAVAMAVVAYLIFAFAPGFTVLLLARFASGAAAANYTIAQAYIADVTTPETRSKGLGLLGAAFGLGFVLGPVLGGLLGGLGDYRAVPLGAAVLSLANLALIAVVLPESLPAERRLGRSDSEGTCEPGETGEPATAGRWLSRESLQRAASDPLVVALMALFFLVTFAFSSMESTLALFVEDRLTFDFQATAWLFTYVGVVMAIVQGGLLGPLVKRFGEARLVVSGLALIALGLLVLPFAQGWPLLAASTALLAIGMGINNPSLLGLISRRTDEARQGMVLGVARSFGALARGLGPLWGGFAFGSLGIGWPFWSAALLMALAVVFAQRLSMRLAAPA